MNIILSGYGKINKEVNKKLKEHNVTIIDNDLDWIKLNDEKKYDLIIDFSIPRAINQIERFLFKHKETSLIIGTTGYNNQQEEIIETISKKHKVIKFDNFSRGMNAFFSLIKELKEYILSSDELYLKEVHNKYKLDSPSGTSKYITTLLNREVPILSIRNGDAIGTHQLDIFLNNEKITLIHEVYSREVFVDGVINSINLIDNLEVGLYTKENINLWIEKK